MLGSYAEIQKQGLDIKAILSQYNKGLKTAEGSNTNNSLEKRETVSTPVETVKEVTVKKQQDLIQDEETDQGNISFTDYWNFFKHSGGIWSFVIFFISTLIPGVL